MDTAVELEDSLSPEGIIDIATEHHQAGRLEDAAILYRRVLDEDPGHVDANHLLGVIAYQQDRFDTAVELIGKALPDRPASDAIRVNFGRALISGWSVITACYRSPWPHHRSIFNLVGRIASS